MIKDSDYTVTLAPMKKKLKLRKLKKNQKLSNQQFLALLLKLTMLLESMKDQ